MMQEVTLQPCGLCRFPHSDIRIAGCGCSLHARCLPVGIVAAHVKMPGQVEPTVVPVTPNSVLCPVCRASAVSSIYLCPMSIEKIEQAVQCRKRGAKGDSKKPKKADGGFDEIQAETSYLLLSHSGTLKMGSIGCDNEYQRTGRWTDEEVAFVDFVVDAFDKGKLPLAHGVRLNDFLCEMLLCKPSRLTKKMKNARLSTRSYELINSLSDAVPLDIELLSSLQEKFVGAITNEATQLEVSFNITRAWRLNVSNLFLQAGSSMLDASDWIASLESMEKRAAEAEEMIRKARRKRMGLALKTDIKSAPDGVFYAGMPVHRPDRDQSMTAGQSPGTQAVALLPQRVSSDNFRARSESSSTNSVASSDEASESDFISNMLDLGAIQSHGPGMTDDFSQLFSDIMEKAEMSGRSSRHLRNNCGSFLEEIVSYMETRDLPFQHVDVWVPSYSKASGSQDQLRLYHAGHATRSDLDPALFCQLHEYGEYSTKFSFAPGIGLPGRVYSSGCHAWECRVDEADPTIFERAGGARVYGIKTGFGLPLPTNVIGRIIIAMYSISDLREDQGVVREVMKDLSKFCPEPKWKLVVDMGPSQCPQQSSGQTIMASHNFPVQHTAEMYGSQSSQNVAHLSGCTAMAPTSIEEEQRIAAILGDHMPLNELPAPGESTSSSSTPSLLVPHFMSLRLLLLRSPERRTAADIEAIEIIRKSYTGYRSDPRRSERDLAYLLVRDWQYLKATMSAPVAAEVVKPAAERFDDSYKSHTMNAPTLATYSCNGAPAQMPPSLGFLDLSTMRSSPFGELSVSSKKRRISSFDADALPRDKNVNFVDDC